MKEIQAQRAGLATKNGNDEDDEESRIGLGHGIHYDTDIYSSMSGGKFAGYVTSIAPTEEQEVRVIMN